VLGLPFDSVDEDMEASRKLDELSGRVLALRQVSDGERSAAEWDALIEENDRAMVEAIGKLAFAKRQALRFKTEAVAREEQLAATVRQYAATERYYPHLA